MAIFKGLYRGGGIYWHGKHGYGDETRPAHPPCRTLAEYKHRVDAIVDAELARELAARTPAQIWWESVDFDTRRCHRQAFDRLPEDDYNRWDSVSEWAYATASPVTV